MTNKIEIRKNPTLWGRYWQHQKTCGTYEVVGTGYREHDLTEIVLYRSRDGIVFSRPVAEFIDGRFVNVDPKPFGWFTEDGRFFNIDPKPSGWFTEGVDQHHTAVAVPPAVAAAAPRASDTEVNELTAKLAEAVKRRHELAEQNADLVTGKNCLLAQITAYRDALRIVFGKD